MTASATLWSPRGGSAALEADRGTAAIPSYQKLTMTKLLLDLHVLHPGHDFGPFRAPQQNVPPPPDRRLAFCAPELLERGEREPRQRSRRRGYVEESVQREGQVLQRGFVMRVQPVTAEHLLGDPQAQESAHVYACDER